MVKLVLKVTPREIYDAFNPRLREATDLLVCCLVDNGCFDSEQLARDWATVQVFNALKNLAKKKEPS